MSECCGGGKCEEKRDLWSWWGPQERTFTVDEVKLLVDKIKEFNAGAIDDHLTKHVDSVFKKWVKELEENA